MKKALIISILLTFLSPAIYAWQPTKTEIDKMVKEAQEKMEKMKNDPIIKETLKKAQDNSSTNISLPENRGKYIPQKFPARNNALLNTLPKKIFLIDSESKPRCESSLAIICNLETSSNPLGTTAIPS